MEKRPGTSSTVATADRPSGITLDVSVSPPAPSGTREAAGGRPGCAAGRPEVAERCRWHAAQRARRCGCQCSATRRPATRVRPQLTRAAAHPCGAQSRGQTGWPAVPQQGGATRKGSKQATQGPRPQRRAARRQGGSRLQLRGGPAIAYWPPHLLLGQNLGPALRQGLGRRGGGCSGSQGAATQGWRAFSVSALSGEARFAPKSELRRAIRPQLKVREPAGAPWGTCRPFPAVCGLPQSTCSCQARDPRPPRPELSTCRRPRRPDRVRAHDCRRYVPGTERKTREPASGPVLCGPSAAAARLAARVVQGGALHAQAGRL